MPITELENVSESVWVKVFANKTSHFVASWYRPPGSTGEEFQLFRELGWISRKVLKHGISLELRYVLCSYLSLFYL